MTKYNILFCILTVGKHGTDARIQEFSSGEGGGTIDERGSQIARFFHLPPVRQTNCNPKSLFLTVFDLRSSIASTFSIATYPVCVMIQCIRNQNNLKQELGVIYIFQSCFC